MLTKVAINQNLTNPSTVGELEFVQMNTSRMYFQQRWKEGLNLCLI